VFGTGFSLLKEAVKFQALKRVVYQVSDLEAAKVWYARLLNVPPRFDTPFVVIFQVNDCSLSLQTSGAPPAEQGDRLAVNWEVITCSYPLFLFARYCAHGGLPAFFIIRKFAEYPAGIGCYILLQSDVII
jgi:hypothetical protein